MLHNTTVVQGRTHTLYVVVNACNTGVHNLRQYLHATSHITKTLYKKSPPPTHLAPHTSHGLATHGLCLRVGDQLRGEWCAVCVCVLLQLRGEWCAVCVCVLLQLRGEWCAV